MTKEVSVLKFAVAGFVIGAIWVVFGVVSEHGTGVLTSDHLFFGAGGGVAAALVAAFLAWLWNLRARR